MGKRRKSPKYHDTYASCVVEDRFGNITESMMKHYAFRSLSLPAKHLYICCRVNQNTRDGRGCLYNHGEEYNESYAKKHFVMPAKHLQEYGFKRTNAVRYFDELIAAGFIIREEANKRIKKVNVYSFSIKWSTLTKKTRFIDKSGNKYFEYEFSDGTKTRFPPVKMQIEQAY